jgi:probable rRNA maturation factor
MNGTDSTKRCTVASADDDDGSSTDADNPPERTEPPASAVLPAPEALHDRIEVQELPGGDARGPRVDVQWLHDRLAAALVHVTRPLGQITVTIVGDEKMRSLNRTHRQVPDTTDVLSFEQSATDEPIEADIVVCADEAARRAAEMEHPIEQELLLYALHGVLHCAGFNDRTDEDFEAMHAEEDRILTAIGVGPTFARDPSGHDDRREPGLVTEDHPLD